jgi:hypothetical protein
LCYRQARQKQGKGKAKARQKQGKGKAKARQKQGKNKGKWARQAVMGIINSKFN